MNDTVVITFSDKANKFAALAQCKHNFFNTQDILVYGASLNSSRMKTRVEVDFASLDNLLSNIQKRYKKMKLDYHASKAHMKVTLHSTTISPWLNMIAKYLKERGFSDFYIDTYRIYTEKVAGIQNMYIDTNLYCCDQTGRLDMKEGDEEFNPWSLLAIDTDGRLTRELNLFAASPDAESDEEEDSSSSSDEDKEDGV